MKKLLVFIVLLPLAFATLNAQPADIPQMIETARNFQQQGDYDNAILVLTKAMQAAPDNVDVIKELSFAYYIGGQNDKALNEIKKLIDREDADEQVFQIAGNIFKRKQDFKEADKLYKKGLKKFPNSGAMYSEYGLVLYQKEPGTNSAIKMWEKGIELDPNYSGNYYHACRFYGTIGNNLWSLLYGEIFVNLESYSTKTIEIKNIVFDIYKQWYVAGNPKGTSTFELQVAEALNNQAKEASYGLTPEVLTAIRTKFILDWNNTDKTRPAFRLFEYQRQLLQEGLFDAYNQWLFGSVNNTAVYQNWVAAHADENLAFVKFQRGRIFKIPTGQYYSKNLL
jgi:tetratricopeptide (TPR) repeat protein